ncbi:hypothetical protein [Paracoccus beibuensis]|uniref:hypothetical protein n=1 Tax=Paracoccus beibuensis TaxID=547602 RepID=UPI002240CD6F|nr:hypothetical protein [Paracoccus beibuensis]
MRPKILHVSSAPKPWQLPDSLWRPRHAESYRQFMRHHPVLQGKQAVYDAGRAPGIPARAVLEAKPRARALVKTPARARKFRRYVRQTQFLLT